MSIILKYEVPVPQPDTNVSLVMLPDGAIIRHVGCQEWGFGENMVLWAEVPGDKGSASQCFVHTLWVFPTGKEFDPGSKRFLGTVLMPRAGLVWHLYEDVREPL